MTARPPLQLLPANAERSTSGQRAVPPCPTPMADWEERFRETPSAIETPVVRFEAA